jgi:hypothetical protein
MYRSVLAALVAISLLVIGSSPAGADSKKPKFSTKVTAVQQDTRGNVTGVTLKISATDPQSDDWRAWLAGAGKKPRVRLSQTLNPPPNVDFAQLVNAGADEGDFTFDAPPPTFTPSAGQECLVWNQ